MLLHIACIVLFSVCAISANGDTKKYESCFDSLAHTAQGESTYYLMVEWQFSTSTARYEFFKS